MSKIDIAHLRELLAAADLALAAHRQGVCGRTSGEWYEIQRAVEYAAERLVNAAPELLDRLEALERIRELKVREAVDACIETCPIGIELDKCNATHQAKVADLEAKLAAAEARIAETENCICWGVECPHQAKALDMVYAREREVDELNAKLAAAEAELKCWRNSQVRFRTDMDRIAEARADAAREEREACAAIADRLSDERGCDVAWEICARGELHADLEAEVARLEPYTMHEEGCGRYSLAGGPTCDCGLDPKEPT